MIEGLYGSVVLRIPDSGTVEIRTGMEFVAAWTIVNLHPDALHARYHAYTDVTIGICRYEDEDSGDTYLRVKVVTDREHPEHLAEAEWLDDGAVDVNAPDLQGGWIR